MHRDITIKISQTLHSIFQNQYIVVGGLVFIGALLRLYKLGSKSLWFDEAVIYWLSQGNINDVIAQNATSNSAPVLFALLINFVLTLNDTVLSLRALPWLAGVAAIPAVYLFSKQILPFHGAYFVAFIVTIASTQIRYSQELREYSMTFLLAVLMLAAFYAFLRERKWSSLIFLVLTWVTGIFLQYGLAILILALNMVFVINWFFSKDQKVISLAKWALVQFIILGATAVVYQLSLKNQMSFGFGTIASTVQLPACMVAKTPTEIININKKSNG